MPPNSRKHYILKFIQFTLKGLILVFRILVGLKRGLEFLGRNFIKVPLKFIARYFIKPILLEIYPFFFRLGREWERIKNSIKTPEGWILRPRFLIHLVIMLASILVIINNVNAKDLREETESGSLLYNLVAGQNQIVESTNVPVIKSSHYLAYRALKSLGHNGHNGHLGSRIGTYSIQAAMINQKAAFLKPTRPITSLKKWRGDIEEYEVQEGDTVSTIAKRFNVSTKTILWANNLSEKDYIKPGQKLIILPVSGVLHKVKSGESLTKIAQKYNADLDAILEFNNLVSPEAIKTGQELIIPGGRIPPPPSPRSIRYIDQRRLAYSIPSSAPVSRSARFQWPTTGRRISQYYTWRHHAIDIPGRNCSSPIYAADGGIVEIAGWNSRGYGLFIVINHGGGYKTLYAHACKIFVRGGQRVSRGQTIGVIGSTGWSTGPHLHFEVIINGRKVNPLGYTR